MENKINYGISAEISPGKGNETGIEKKEKLWSMNFFLLWQGQFISVFGDVIFDIALGFWVMAVTGSTAIMGTMMGASAIPRVLISPFAGVIVDRVDRKWLMVAMDIIRGVCVVFIGIAAYWGTASIWMMFAAAIMLGVCEAFFIPSVSSVMPSIVPKSKLIGANSIFGMIQTCSNILGNSLGGVLFQILGAPLLFVANGISYLASALGEVFIKLPPVRKVSGEQNRFIDDIKDGYKFLWNFEGLKQLLVISSMGGVITSTAMVLILPLFQRTQSLGAGKYGFAMALLAAGMLCGMMYTSIVKIPPAKRLTNLLFCTVTANVCFILFILAGNFFVMGVLIFIGGGLMSVNNVLVYSMIQLIVPQDMRGKVFALMGMAGQALTPLGIVLGGVLGEFFPIRGILLVCFLIGILLCIPFVCMPVLGKLMSFEPGEKI